MFSGYNFIALLLLVPVIGFSQIQDYKTYRKEISVTTDNDRYMLQGKDGYYTNGLIVRYNVIAKSSNDRVIKKINHVELGQKIFSAFSRKIYNPSDIDRPIAGYLYAKFMQSRFIRNQQLLQWGISVGTIGNSSMGEGLQNVFHRLIHVNSKWWGWTWNYQLKNEPGINAHLTYAKNLINNGASAFQLTPVTQATAGTIFTNISQGVMIQFGKQHALHESAWFNARLQHEAAQQAGGYEFYFFYYPQLQLQLYNATIQGGMFRKDKGPFTTDSKPLVMTQEVGALWAAHRYTLIAKAVFQSREANTQRFSQLYGSMQLGYRWW